MEKVNILQDPMKTKILRFLYNAFFYRDLLYLQVSF